MRHKRKTRGRAERAALEAVAADAGVEITAGEVEGEAAEAETVTEAAHAAAAVERRRAVPGPAPGTTIEISTEHILAELEASERGEAEAASEEAPQASEADAAGAIGEDGVVGEDGVIDDDTVGEEDVAVDVKLTAAQLDDDKFRALVEALLFAADKPLTVARLRQLTRVSDTARIQAALDALIAAHADTGIVVSSISGGYSLRTHSAYSPWVQQLIQGRPVRLSRAQLETLAIVAYRQPITRPEIDQIRGVDSGATLKLLLDRSLIRILGKREEVGRPLLYGTTKEFLDFFSLNDLRELPTLREYSELSEESRGLVARLGHEVPTMMTAVAVAETESVPEPEPEPEPDAEPDVLGSPDPDDAIVDANDDEAY